MSLTDTLINFGGELKALDDSGKVGGYLVLFGDPENTDASDKRDYFTPDTDFGPFTKSVMLFDHTLDPELGSIEIGEAELKTDKVGVWMEGHIKVRKEYEKRFGPYIGKIKEGVKSGVFGLSSGTAAHLVRREPQANGSHKILRWPLGLDASITPAPAEPRTLARPIKSLSEYKGDSPTQDMETEPHAGLRLDEHSESVRAAVKGLHDRLADLVAKRADAGRSLSEVRRAELKALAGDLAALVSLAEPRPTVDECRALEAEFLAIEAKLSGLN